MSDVTFKLNQSGGAEILRRNEKIQQLERTAFSGVLTNIEAQFFQTFGVEGKFEIVEFETDRHNIKIQAADKPTGAILKANPGWLATFIPNIQI